MSERISVYKVRFVMANEITVQKDGFLHCKTTPFYIFAQAFEGHYEVESEKHQAVCEPGGAFFSAPGTPLRIHHFVDPKTGWMHIRYLHFMLENEHGIDPFAVRSLPLAISAFNSNKIAGGLARLIHSSREPFVNNIQLLRILTRLYQLTKPEPKPKFGLEYVEKLCSWIREQAKEPLTVEAVIVKSGYSRSKVFADFLDLTGMSPGDFILRERIVVSKRMLLEDSRLSIKEISSNCGWKNPYHFSRAFKSIAGVSPRMYRNYPLY